MPILTRCPRCRATFNLPDALAGKNAKCSRCQQLFLVPVAAPQAKRPDDVPEVPKAEPVGEPTGPTGGGMTAKPAPRRMRSPDEPPWDPFAPGGGAPYRERVPAPRRASQPPRQSQRSGTSTGWIIALAVGVPVLLVLFLACGLGSFFLYGVYTAARTAAANAAAAKTMASAPKPPPPINPAPMPPGPNAPVGPAPVVPDPFNPPPPPPRDPPPPLKPVAAVEIAPPDLAQDKVVKPLPAPVADVAVGGGGRFLVLYLAQQKKLAVFDVNTAEMVKYLSFTEPNLKFAAGMDKLIVALPSSRLLRAYSLKTFDEVQSAPPPFDGDVDALCMGSASNGPLWVQPKGNAGFSPAPVLVDPSTLKEWPADWGDRKPPGGAYIRASEDGRVFSFRAGVGGEPHEMYCVTLTDGRAAVQSSGDVGSSLLVPDADGRNLYAGCAVYSAQLAPLFPNPPPQSFCKPFLPSVGVPYFARLDYTQWDQVGGDLAFFAPGAQEPFATLKGVEGVTNEQIAYGANRDTLTHDHRVILLPAARVVVTIPKSNDRLILTRFDPDAALEKWDRDYLVVTSRPPPVARKNQEYAYSLAVKSKKGGVKFRLESGPKGMAIDAAGKLTWTPPPDAAAENEVIVSARDAGGQETLHTFRVGVE